MITDSFFSNDLKLDKNTNPHEADFLKLNIAKAELKLGWKPVWELNYTLEKIVDWHKAWLNKIQSTG
jgi:CDP-glucose 4,6-dehydratase